MQRTGTGLFIVILLFSTLLYGQIEENLERYSGDNGKKYIKPLVDGLGVSMNRGWYGTAKIPGVGLRIRLGVVAMVAPVLDRDKTFEATTQGDFHPVQTVDAPTVVGSEESVTVIGTGGTQYVFPGGLEMNATAFATPQLTIGCVYGTELMLRYFMAELGDSEIGKLSLTGIGLRHSIDQYIPLSPVHLAVGVFWQKIELGDELLSFSTLHIGAQVSRSFGLFELYGGIGYDNSSVKLQYSYNTGSEDLDIDLDMDGDNGLQVTAGFGFNLFILHISGDCTIGTRTAYCLSTSIGL
ncbi:hypothetical protein JXO59_05190 [candidate division KSB1 bacterium]|nr:hypothetical protein [candidate division KSB1 bacterium]